MATRPPLSGPVDQHLPVEPPRAQQRRIEDLGPVGGRQQDHADPRIEAVELGEQLVERLLLLVVAAEGAGHAAAPQRIEFVDEDDAGRRLARLLEQVANARRADPDEHLDELRAGDREERDPGLTGHGAGEQRLAGARRPDQQNALGNMRPEPAVALGILEKGHHFLQLEFRLVDAGHVGEGDLGVLLDIDLGARLADRHESAKALSIREAAAEKDPDHIEQHDGYDPRQDGLKQPARRRTGYHHAFRRQFIGERRIDTGGHKGRLSARQLVLHSALDGILTDGDLGDVAFGDQLLELAEGNGVDPAVRYPAPIPARANRGQQRP